MPTTLTCPYCHTPIRVDRYEYATSGAHTYRICPECDFSMPMPVAPTAKDSETGTGGALPSHVGADADV